MSNTIGVVGRLTRDVEQRSTPNGNVATSFCVASSTGYGQREVTTFYNCTYWRKADGLIQYLVKGAQVFIAGEFCLREYTAKDGSTGKSADINVNSIQLVGGGQNPQESYSEQQAPQAPTMSGPAIDDSQGIPF